MKVLLHAALALGVAGCQPEAAREEAEPTAEVGVFFGGQVQHVKRVEVPPVRVPKIGFRVLFPENVSPAQKSEVIEYEVVRPGPAGRRVTEKGTLRLPTGQDRVDHVIALSPSDRLGVWNVRVVQSQTVLADRAIYLSAGPALLP